MYCDIDSGDKRDQVCEGTKCAKGVRRLKFSSVKVTCLHVSLCVKSVRSYFCIVMKFMYQTHNNTLDVFTTSENPYCDPTNDITASEIKITFIY